MGCPATKSPSNPGPEPTTANVNINSCPLAQQSVPVVITAGVEKLDPKDYKATNEGADYLSCSESLSELGCPQRALQSILLSRISTTTTTSGAVANSGAAIDTTPTTGPLASQNSPTPSSTTDGQLLKKPGSGFVLMDSLLAPLLFS